MEYEPLPLQEIKFLVFKLIVWLKCQPLPEEMAVMVLPFMMSICSILHFYAQPLRTLGP